MKKKMAIVVMALVLTGLMAATCSAAWYNCTISGIGAGATSGSAQLVGVSDAGVALPLGWYALDPTPANLNRLVAIGLTALSNGTQVRISFTPGVSTNISIMYALNTPG